MGWETVNRSGSELVHQVADGGGAVARGDSVRHEAVPRHRRLRQRQAQDGRRQDERLHVPGAVLIV